MASASDKDAAIREAMDTLITSQTSSSQRALEIVEEYVKILKLDLSKLRVIHVAGTKGKGSTCAFVESALRACKLKTGLFTSPHLIDYRERFRINGKIMDLDLFASYFWHVFNALKAEVGDSMPGFFSFWTLLAFHVFICEGVDVTVLEVGLGGRLDATNVIPPPLVAAVTLLDYDHQRILGSTLTEIAGEKAGIFKPGSICITMPQPQEAMDSLVRSAVKAGVVLHLCPPLEAHTLPAEYPTSSNRLELAVGGDFMRDNAALAMSVVSAFFARYPGPTREPLFQSQCVSEWGRADTTASDMPVGAPSFALPLSVCTGLSAATWPGRCQMLSIIPTADGGIVTEGGGDNRHVTLFVDGAHTLASVGACTKWFGTESSRRAADGAYIRRLLVFYCTPDRDVVALLGEIHRSTTELFGEWNFETSLFTVPDSSRKTTALGVGEHVDVALQMKQGSKLLGLLSPDFREEDITREQWLQGVAVGGLTVRATLSLDHVFGLIASLTPSSDREQVHVLVTGSLYLVGDVLRRTQARSFAMDEIWK